MKTLAEMGRVPTHRGYLATCKVCGRVVVHAESTGLPFHMHARSARCRDALTRALKRSARQEYGA